MNNSLQLNNVELSDKFEITEGRIFITGTQAIIRLPLIQKSLDTRAGLNTSGYISGYRGSPMGTVDNALWREKKRMKDAGVVFQPGVNEDLAATAIWGTQQLDAFADPLVDGVYSMWYGKGPGVDRSCDVMRHANIYGTHKNGGVLVVYGDDHPGKSSSVVNQSDPALAALHIPSLYPSNVQEIIDFGLLGWAMSRYSSLWVGIKCVNETVEQTQTVDIAVENLNFVYPDKNGADDIIRPNSAWVPPAQAEVILKRHKLPLIHKFVKANNINKTIINGAGGLGIVTAGKSYQDVLQAMNNMGLTPELAESLGIGLYKVGCIWPLEPTGLKDFAKGRAELFFIEEKAGIMEEQAASILINEPIKPFITGKVDVLGNTLLPSDVQVEPSELATFIMARIQKYGVANAELNSKFALLNKNIVEHVTLDANGHNTPLRTPYFCSGCPHSTSTKVPEGSMAMAGIGCHTMRIFMNKDTLPPTHMGGEGMNWAGVAHFTGTKHMFQNLGDGTYFHSGLLAIRGAVAANVNITYKILYNDAVAMTGGQPIDGTISVSDMIDQVRAEGVVKCVVVTDNTENYRNGSIKIASGIEVHHRDDLDAVQKQMRDIEGCSVLIFEQTCAAEKRRRRKKGLFPNPAKRLFINDAVCEGCGDCSVQSTCVSIQPEVTEFGTKRKIDQSSCNKDFSCVKGFCPSFVTVLGAEPKKPQGVALDGDLFAQIPPPEIASFNKNMGIMIAGIGGTGVITVGAVMGMAAHLEGKACSIYDMTGLSQKNGSVYSHLRIANDNANLTAQRIGKGEADLIMAFDILASLAGDSGITFNKERTSVIGNSDISPTAAFQFNPDMIIDSDMEISRIERQAKDGASHFVDATNLALKLMGDTIASNMFVVGYAAQKGMLPMSVAALTKAIELNGIAVSFNQTAFSLGRLYAHQPLTVKNLLPENTVAEQPTLTELIDHRKAHLTAYQDEAYANRYIAIVEQVKNAESALVSTTKLTGTVAINLAKLMSYKDEYEVARLYTDPSFKQKLDEQFEPGYTVKFNLAPPLLSKLNKSSGLPIKAEYGAWVMTAFKLLAKFKWLRGGSFDLFGKTAERKMERALIVDYIANIQNVIGKLSTDNLEQVIELARLPEQIKGYGHVKKANIEATKKVQQTIFNSL